MAAWDSDPIIKEVAPTPAAKVNAWDAAPIVAAARPRVPASPARSAGSELPEVGAFGSFARGIGDGLTFGLSDEIIGGASAALGPVLGTGSEGDTFSDRYDKNVAEQRGLLRAGMEQHPIASIAGGVAGGLIPALATGGATAGASIGGAVARGAVVGAGYGGAYGFGSAEGDVIDRLPEAGRGALIGATVGGVIPVAVGGAGKVIRSAANKTQAELTGQQASIQAARDTQAAANAAGGTADVASEQAGAVRAAVEAAQAGSKAQAGKLADLAQEVAPNQQILAAADRLGLKDDLIPSQYSRSQSYREMEQALASIPGSALNAAQKEGYQKLAQKADDLITTYGGSLDKSAFSDKFKTQSQATIADLEAQSNKLYDDVASAIPAMTKTAPNDTITHLNNKVAELGDRSLLSGAERRTLSSLTRTDESGNAIEPTYAALDYLRKQVGQGLRGSGPFKDAESGSLKSLYAALSKDQQRAADSLGVGSQFSAAKALVAQRKEIEDNMVSVLGKDLDGAVASTFGSATERLGAGDFKQFDKIIGAIPKDLRQEAVLTALNNAFTKSSRAEQKLSAPGFVDWYDSLSRNSAAKSRLVQHLPEQAAKTLDDIATVARGMREASKERITTGRLNSVNLLEQYADEGGLLSKIWDVSRKVGVAEGVSSGVGFPGAGTVGVLATTLGKEKTPIKQAAEAMIASQKFKDAVYTATVTDGAQIGRMRAKEAQLMKTLAYKKWFAALGENARTQIAAVGPVAYLTTGEEQPPKAIELPATVVTPER